MKALKHLQTINHHKLLVMKHCFKVGLYKQGLLHDLSKYCSDRISWSAVGIIREQEVRIMQNGKQPGILLRGCITKVVISIIMNTGLITV